MGRLEPWTQRGTAAQHGHGARHGSRERRLGRDATAVLRMAVAWRGQWSQLPGLVSPARAVEFGLGAPRPRQGARRCGSVLWEGGGAVACPPLACGPDG